MACLSVLIFICVEVTIGRKAGSEGEEVKAQSGADEPLPNIIHQDSDRPPEVNEEGWTDAPCCEVNEMIPLEDRGMTVLSRPFASSPACLPLLCRYRAAR